MTQDDILRIAREAELYEDGKFFVVNHDELERFAALVAAAEREACAKVCEDKALEVSAGLHSQAQNDYFDGYYFARAIRTRGI